MDFEAICQKSRTEPGFFETRLKEQLTALRLRGPEINALIRQYVQNESATDQMQKGPLFGLTFTVKDNIAVAGQPMTAGLKPALQSCCEADAPIVSTLKGLGALLIGSTNLDELCLSATGYNSHYGGVMNPRFPRMSSLGSSSGSAAAVAAGFCDFALGSDFGGSVRLPAAACGVCGLKFSPNLFDCDGILLIDDVMDGPGILAPSIADILFISQMLLQKTAKPISRLRGLIPAQVELDELPELIRSAFVSFVELVGRQFEVGGSLTGISFQELNLARRAVVAEAIRNKAQSLKLSSNLYPPALQAIMLLAQKTPNFELNLAKELLTTMGGRVESVVNDGWLIITPALGAMPPASNGSSIIGKVISTTWQFTTLANMSGLPAVVFAPLRDSRPESSVQLIGGAGTDLQLMEAAKKLVEACGP